MVESRAKSKSKSLQKRSLKHLKPFILANFEASWEIELLMIMHREPARSWTFNQLSEKLLIDCASIDRCVSKLIDSGLVAYVPADEAYNYLADTAEKNALVELLSSALEHGRLSVMRMIYD